LPLKPLADSVQFAGTCYLTGPGTECRETGQPFRVLAPVGSIARAK